MDVHAFRTLCAERAAHMQVGLQVVSMPTQDLEQFVRDEDAGHYDGLLAWWPRQRGAPHPPTLEQMASAAVLHDSIEPRTFYQTLLEHHAVAARWCELHKVSTADPNETTDQRRRRLQRERMRDYRADKRGQRDARADNPGLVAAEAELARLVAERDRELAGLDERVRAADEQFKQVCAERKEQREHHRQRVDEQREAVRLLRQV